MMILKLYDTYQEAYFLERPNRFVMHLETKNGDIIHAHVPNTGRMEEFCVERHPFFITALKQAKYPYKVIATTYQNQYVFLDTIKVNYLFLELLRNNYIPLFQHVTKIKREVTIGDSKFDFRFEHHNQEVIVEIKSCTLCHNRLAMFPDAPTLRGQRHLAGLERIASETELSTYVVFLILNVSAERFMPNFHTDFDYGRLLLSTKSVQLKTFKLHVVDPVSIDLHSLQEVPIDLSTTRTHCQNKGSYLLLLENSEDIEVTVGKLGNVRFQKGWYVYVGSALNSLDSRLKRHQRKHKKHFWHIDYIASTAMKIKKVYPIRRLDRIESQLAQKLQNISDGCIKGFGTSDTQDVSHLFYFNSFPLRRRAFVDILFDARTI